MVSTDQAQILGALGTGLADSILEVLTVKKYFPYIEIHKVLPPLDDLIVGLGIPALVYGLGRVTGNKALQDAAEGCTAYGATMLAGVTAYRVALQAKQGPGQFHIAMDWPEQTNIIRQASWLDVPYVRESVHSGEFLPFQTDMGL